MAELEINMSQILHGIKRAEILEQRGNKTAAIADYEKAYDYSKDNVLRATIKQRLDALQAK